MPVLTHSLFKREIFNPKNTKHLKSFDHFVKTGIWGDIKFHAELPYVEVPTTVLMKYAQSQRKVVRQTAECAA